MPLSIKPLHLPNVRYCHCQAKNTGSSNLKTHRVVPRYQNALRTVGFCSSEFEPLHIGRGWVRVDVLLVPFSCNLLLLFEKKRIFHLPSAISHHTSSISHQPSHITLLPSGRPRGGPSLYLLRLSSTFKGFVSIRVITAFLVGLRQILCPKINNIITFNSKLIRIFASEKVLKNQKCC